MALRLTAEIMPNVENHNWNNTQIIIRAVIAVFVFPE